MSKFFLPDALTHQNVEWANQQLKEALGQIQKTQALQIDCSSLKTFDSSALSWMMAAWRQAHELGVVLKFEQVPAQLQSLAKVYGLQEISQVWGESL